MVDKMMKKIIALLVLCLFVTTTAVAAANYSISDVELDKHGNTVDTTCVNTKGFYFDIGHAQQKLPLMVKGFEHDMPIVMAIHNTLYPGWKVIFNQAVDKTQKITWIGQALWTEWLQKLAFDYNLAIIVDWTTKTLYINKL